MSTIFDGRPTTWPTSPVIWAHASSSKGSAAAATKRKPRLSFVRVGAFVILTVCHSVVLRRGGQWCPVAAAVCSSAYPLPVDSKEKAYETTGEWGNFVNTRARSLIHSL